jgi:hypothetical protein
MTSTWRSRLPRASLVAAAALTALLGLYVWLVAARAVALLRTGEPVGIALGAGVLLLPLLGAWSIVREWRLAVDVQRMADELAAVGALRVDDLPRSPGGRIDRTAAGAQFEVTRGEVEAAPDAWGSWYRLAFAYDAAGDRRRARESLRTASRLHRAA